MSNFFSSFPKVLYLFGNNEEPNAIQDLTKYSDLIDQVGRDIATYTEYEIIDGERPDTLSHSLYGTPSLDWTFFLMNERLRETGWPMTLKQVYDRAQTDFYPNYTAKLDISTADSAAEYSSLYDVGQSVLVSGRSGVVVSKDLNLGEITISSDSDLTTGTLLQYSDNSNPVALTNTVNEWEGTHHWEDGDGEWADRWYSTETILPITNLEHLVAQNDASKRIRLIKKEFIAQIAGEYRRRVQG